MCGAVNRKGIYLASRFAIIMERYRKRKKAGERSVSIVELMFEFNPEDKRHLYEQIYVYLRDEIRSGNLHPGERLPSTRSFAAALKIARTTVELAYEQLEEEGYLVIRRGSGAYVCEITNIPDLRNTKGRKAASFVCSEKRLLGAATLADGREQDEGENPKAEKPEAWEKEPEAERMDEIDFSLRTIDMSVFPYATWRRILRGILTGDRSELFRRGDPRGDQELRITIARYLHLSRGCHCTPEQIIIGAGNDYLLMVLAMVLGEQSEIGSAQEGNNASAGMKRHIAMDEFTYLRAAEVMRGMGYRIEPVPLDEQGMNVEELERSGAGLVYVMPARQFPTGQVMTYPGRTQLLSWAAGGEDRYIIEDDYDSEFKYRGRPVPSLQSADENGTVIYMGTFSKSIAPAIRISYMILPEKLLPAFYRRAGFLSCTVPRLDQAVLNEFIRNGYFERYLNRMRNRYKAKHDRMLELLHPLEDRFVITGQGAGLHLVLHAREGRMEKISEKELVEQARLKEVKVYGMSEQCLPEAKQVRDGDDRQGRAVLLLGYASLTDEEMREGTKLLCESWRCGEDA
jgi:GntR family transcriptional regulator / MocR family aminotransferase